MNRPRVLIQYSFVGKSGKLNFRTGWTDDLIQAARRYGQAVVYIKTGGLLLSAVVRGDLSYEVNIPKKLIKTSC